MLVEERARVVDKRAGKKKGNGGKKRKKFGGRKHDGVKNNKTETEKK